MRIPKRLFRYRPIEAGDVWEREFEALKESFLYSVPLDKLNDPFELERNYREYVPYPWEKNVEESKRDAKKIRKEIENLRKGFGVISMSGKQDLNSVWSYYSSNHAGMCLEFSTSTLNFGTLRDAKLERVHYNSRRNFDALFDERELAFESDSAVERLIHTELTAKTIHWKHEREWRYICRSSGKFHYFDDALTGVYFGYKAEHDHKLRVAKLLRNRRVNIYHAKLVGSSLVFEMIQDRSFGDIERAIPNGYDDLIELIYEDENVMNLCGKNHENLVAECRHILTNPNIDRIYHVGADLKERTFQIRAWCGYRNNGKRYDDIVFVLNHRFKQINTFVD